MQRIKNGTLPYYQIWTSHFGVVLDSSKSSYIVHTKFCVFNESYNKYKQ